MTTENTPSTSGSSEAKTSGFSSVGEVLKVTDKRVPKCARCNDRGLPEGSELRYTRWGEPVVYGPVCDCPSGVTWAALREEEKRVARERQGNALERRRMMLRDRCNLPTRMKDWTLDTYPGDPGLVAVAREYLEALCIEENGKAKVGLMLLGKSGVGKSGLAAAILNECINMGVDSLFWEVGSFLRAIRGTFSQRSERTTEEVTDPARSVEFLVLDDIGDVGRGGNSVSDFTRGEIFDLVNHRYNELMATVFTSNLTAKQMADQFGEPIWWRMADMCLVVEVGGKNLRA